MKSYPSYFAATPKPDRYTEVALRKILNDEEKRKYLQDMTEQIAPIMPSCKQAKEEGY